MRIEGWAFKEEGDRIRDERRKRFSELDKDDFSILDCRYGYAQKTYQLVVKNKKISELDMLIYCDGGNTCFGGRVCPSSKIDEDGNPIYTVTVYID